MKDVRLEDYDRVFAMSDGHLKCLPEGCPGVLLSSITGQSGPVKDPYGGDLSVYRGAFTEIREHLQALLLQESR